MQQNNNYKSFQLLKELQLEYPNFQEQALITLQEKLRIKSNNIATLILEVYSMTKLDNSNIILKKDMDQKIMISCDTILGLDRNNCYALWMKIISLYDIQMKQIIIEQQELQQAILSVEQGLMLNSNNSHLNYLKGFALKQVKFKKLYINQIILKMLWYFQIQPFHLIVIMLMPIIIKVFVQSEVQQYILSYKI